MAECVPELGLSGRALIVDDDVETVTEAVRAAGVEVREWHRRAIGGQVATPWVEEGPFDSAIVRLPVGREAFEMILHAALSRLRPGGSLFVYGTNDEGVRSAVRPMAELCGEVTTVDTRRHSRVIGATRPDDVSSLRGDLGAWRRTVEIELAPAPGSEETGGDGRGVEHGVRQMVSYPGVFAHGRLDAGTRALLAVLSTLKLRGLRGRREPNADADADADAPAGVSERPRVLDFGCGIGVIGAAVLARWPDADVDLLDVYALSVEAARENVPGAHAILGDGWSAPLTGSRQTEPRYDLIVSNPPFHSGKGEDFRVLDTLIAGAPAHLREQGELLIVVQRTVPANQLLAESFATVERVSESPQFTVWRGRGQLRGHKVAR